MMNSKLEQCWRLERRPFDGPVLVADDDLDPESLLKLLQLTLRQLRMTYQSSTLLRIEDWHDHDGIVTAETQTSWNEVDRWAADTASLIKSCSDDWQVHTLIFPAELEFCLRYWLGPEGECSFDLSATDSIVQALAELLHSNSLNVKVLPSSKAYFDSRFGG